MVILACLVGAPSACVFAPLEKSPPPAAAPETASAEPSAPVPDIAPPEPAKPEQPPAPSAPPPPLPPDRIIVLLPRDDEGFERALPELERELTERGFDVVAIEAQAAPYVLPAPKPRQKTLAIAIGGEAEQVAARLDVPTVFCQTALIDTVEEPGQHGVPALPPLSLQLRAWKQLSPALARVALILGPGRDATAAEAERAAAAESVSLTVLTATSDQEALYLFRRLAPEIDGLWLLPDNTALSPRVIKSMLEHASRHKVQTLVFTPTLLEWGGLASVSSTPGNLARTLADVVSRLATAPKDVPAVTPLSEVEVAVNEGEAAKLGLHPPARSWVVRGEGS